MEADNRFYFPVENPDRSLQVYAMPVVSSMSTMVNFLSFYLIFTQSGKESREYRMVLFFHNLSLYLAQLFWGSIINMVFLLPFPAVYSIGPLRHYFNCFYLTGFWFALFGWSALMMFWVLLVRLRALARRDSVFCFGRKAYYTIIVILVLYVFPPIFGAWIPGFSSEEKTREYVLKYYPNCLKALELPGIFVNTSPAAILAVTIVSFGLLTSGALLYILLCCIIIVEIKKQSCTWSRKKRHYHLKVLKDTVIQNLVKCVFLAAAPATELWNIFLDPSTDTIFLTMMANIIFVAAPIPCTLLTFFQTRTYRNFFARSLGCYFCISGNSNVSKLDNSRKTGAIIFTVQPNLRMSNQ